MKSDSGKLTETPHMCIDCIAGETLVQEKKKKKKKKKNHYRVKIASPKAMRMDTCT